MFEKETDFLKAYIYENHYQIKVIFSYMSFGALDYLMYDKFKNGYPVTKL